MKGKIALVTGANGGLGTFVTQALLEAGATVIGLSQRIEQSAFNSPNFTALPADISTAAGAKTAVDSLVSRFGRLDILAHTVGGFAGGQSIAETDDATFQRMFALNLYSTFYLLRAAIPAMRKAGNGRIVAIGSRAALEPGAGVGAYSASKAAMVSLIRTVAQENKDVGNDRQCHPARHHGHAGQPEIHAELRPLQMGSPVRCRQPDRMAGRRCRQRCQWSGDSGLRRRSLRFCCEQSPGSRCRESETGNGEPGPLFVFSC